VLPPATNDLWITGSARSHFPERLPVSDINEVTQLILHERQGRDRGWWQQMRDAFWPDSTVNLSWFTGSGPDFVARSEDMSGRGDRSVHRIAAPVVHVHGDRAYAEAATAVEFQIDLDGVRADLISYTRLNYRLERRNGTWGVLSLDAIYERDTLAPKVPGQNIPIAPEVIKGRRPSYALLAYYLDRRGYRVGTDLLGDDQPARVDAFYAGLLAWLKNEPTAAHPAPAIAAGFRKFRGKKNSPSGRPGNGGGTQY
jgi:hypothetical protein